MKPVFSPIFTGRMTDQTEQLSRLVGEIYDAAIDASKWSDVLGKAAQFIGGSSAALFSKDAASGAGNIYYEFGTDPYYRQLYFEKYVKLDPATIGHFFAEVEQPIAVADLMPYHEFLETRFYREWVQPQGVVDFVAAVLDKSATSVAMFGVFRHQRDGVVDDEARRRVRLIIPHIRRAVLVSRIIDLKTTEAATFADTLDGLSAGMCLVDANGRIVHANVAGRAILDASDFLSATRGHIVARDAMIDKVLRELFAASGGGDTAIGTEGIALPLMGQDGTRYVAHVLPLTLGARRFAGVAYSATAALFIRKSAIEVPSSAEVIARAYKLTPSELRVLLAIVEVGGVPEVAVALGVAESTVKTHLGHLFEKTGVTRQADLVKIVAGFSTPFAG
jgi:DNA-binding CsgD family transcriptional regulator/PAS domain-containing protein